MRIELQPAFCVQVYLDKFHNVELQSRGYYQVRLTPKAHPDLTVDIGCERSSVSSPGYEVLPCSVQNGTGISRTLELVFADESLPVDDVFNLSAQATSRGSLTNNVYRLELAVELWYAERDRPPRNENFSFLSRRIVEIELHLDSAQWGYRLLTFEFYAFSAITLCVSTSLVSMLARRKKNPPDPGFSPKLRTLYAQMSSALLHTTRSLEMFIANNAGLVSTSLQIEPTAVDSEVSKLCDAIENSSAPWSQLEADAVRLSARLSATHGQFLQLFSRSQQLISRLSKDFDDWRWRRLSEAFFFHERAMSELFNDVPNRYIRLHACVISSPYLRHLKRTHLFCASMDSPPELCPVIFEDRFLPSPSTPTSSANGNGVVKRIDMNDNGKGNGATITASVVSSSNSSTGSPQKSARSFASFRFRRKSMGEARKKLLYAGRRGSAGDMEAIVMNACSISARDAAVTPTNSDIVVPLPRGDEATPASPTQVSSSFPLSECSQAKIDQLVDLVRERQVLKTKLTFEHGYDGCIYSEMATALRPPSLAEARRNFDRAAVLAQSPHLIVFVHGLEGGMDDLTPYKNFLRVSLPSQPMLFLMSQSNHLETWQDLEQMGANLLDEIAEYAASMPRPPDRISFVAHSLGGIIVRTAVGRADAEWLRAKTHTLLTLNTPHLGLAYGARVSSLGVAVVQWWKKSRSIEQLAIRDAVHFHDSFLYNLSKNKSLSAFRYVLIVGASGDVYVPLHSSLMEPCKNMLRDASALGTAVREMLHNMKDDILTSEKRTTLIRYTVFHNMETVGRAHRLSGRAAHTAVVDDDLFIEKLICVSALKYFK